MNDIFFSLQGKGSTYLVYDNFNNNNFVINRSGKISQDSGKPMSKVSKNNLSDKDKDNDVMVVNIGGKEVKELKKINRSKENIITRQITKGHYLNHINQNQI